MRPEYYGVKFYSKSDLSIAGNLEKAISILKLFDENKDYTNVNEIIELYNIDLIMNCGISLPDMEESQVDFYKKICKRCMKVIERFYSKINESNLLEICNTVCIGYIQDHWGLFTKFKVYERISGEIFEKYLYELDTALWVLLREKKLVKHYGKELAKCLRNSEQTASLIISNFLERHEQELLYYFPKELTTAEYEEILDKYVRSEKAHYNDLRIIAESQSTKECPISDRLRLSAKRACDSYWANKPFNGVQLEYGIGIEFKEDTNLVTENKENNNWIITYDVKWLTENVDYPTILNNFRYVFDHFDKCWRSNLVSIKSKIGSFERMLLPRGKKHYLKGNAFKVMDIISTMQLRGYYDILKDKKIRLEDVFQWFFEKYLSEEFGVVGFRFNPPSVGTTLVEKCRTLASEMDGIFKQFRMYVQEGEIDRELFEMSSAHIVFSQLPSLIKNKYAYVNDQQIHNEHFLLFSDQSLLRYTEKVKSKYKSFCELLLYEKMQLSDFEEFQKRDIEWLAERGSIVIQKNGLLTLNNSRIFLLKDLYDHDVICVQYYEQLGEWIDLSELRIGSSLFSEPEQDYLNYMLNKSAFSNGLDLRNKYSHSTYPSDEQTQLTDYVELLKIMILVIGKINEEFCLTGNRD